MYHELKNIIGNNEKILWEGKPDKKCFVLESIFNPLLPVAIIWAIFDFSFIGFGVTDAVAGGESQILLFIIPFFLLHLMPVWIYLGGILLSKARYKNINYIVTDRAIYTSSGIINKHIQNKPFAEMSHVNLHRGLFDQKFGLGDIICTSSQNSINGNPAVIKISSIADYANVYNIIKKLQQDIFSDIMYPNDKRPKENHGYNTEYKGL